MIIKKMAGYVFDIVSHLFVGVIGRGRSGMYCLGLARFLH